MTSGVKRAQARYRSPSVRIPKRARLFLLYRCTHRNGGAIFPNAASEDDAKVACAGENGPRQGAESGHHLHWDVYHGNLYPKREYRSNHSGALNKTNHTYAKCNNVITVIDSEELLNILCHHIEICSF